jgi:hypothetical protein
MIQELLGRFLPALGRHQMHRTRRGELTLEKLRRSSGRRIWKATVTLPDAGKVEFVSDVIY